MLGTGVGGRLRVFMQSVGVATMRLVGPKPGVIAHVAVSHPDMIKFARELVTDIPQAACLDDTATLTESRRTREDFAAKLSGVGLEIGALHRPLPQHPGMRSLQVDRHTAAELRSEYSTLGAGWLDKVVEPDIIDDGATLATVTDASYDYVIACHVIEHLPNPIAALQTWCRVLKPGGLIYLIVPDKRATFDRPRVRTTLEHLILDYRQPSRERDFEHFLDYAVHVHRAAGNDALTEAERLRTTDFSIHFHVFQPADIVALLRWFGTNIRPVSIVDGPILDPDDAGFHLLVKVV
jgi:SAM-dependent methyltransferase